jgi:hypothetical protein
MREILSYVELVEMLSDLADEEFTLASDGLKVEFGEAKVLLVAGSTLYRIGDEGSVGRVTEYTFEEATVEVTRLVEKAEAKIASYKAKLAKWGQGKEI